jgi:hypothetical protein
MCLKYSMYRVHTSYIQCMYVVCMKYVWSVYAYSIHIVCTEYLYSMYIECVHSIYRIYIYIVLIEYVHGIYRIYTYIVHVFIYIHSECMKYTQHVQISLYIIYIHIYIYNLIYTTEILPLKEDVGMTYFWSVPLNNVTVLIGAIQNGLIVPFFMSILIKFWMTV